VETASASETESRYEYEEVDTDDSMRRVEDYFGYLEKRDVVTSSITVLSRGFLLRSGQGSLDKLTMII
jgi:hypothetical protein